MKDIKTKFGTLQSNVQKLNNEKIGLESEIKTITADQKELVNKILELTGKDTIEEAYKFYNAQSDELESRKEKLEKELDNYLETKDLE